MSEQEAHQTGSITDSESEKENELIVNNDPVIKTAIDTEFVFADPAGTAIIPIERFFRELIEPLVGIGLVFL